MFLFYQHKEILKKQKEEYYCFQNSIKVNLFIAIFSYFDIDYTIKVQKTKCDNDDHDESAIWSIVLERREPKPQMETRPLEEMIFSKLDCRQVLHSVSIKELGGDDRRTWRSKIEIVARDWFGEESEVEEWGWVSWVSGDVAVSGRARNLYLEGLNIKLDNWLFLCIYWLYSY